MPLTLFNTLTGRVEPVIPRDPSRITFYTCGPTVYDDAHIGNFRSFLAADALRRWLESPLCTLATDPHDPLRVHHGPRRVVHVMNITDVGHMTDDASADGGGEDKMQAAARRIAEAKKTGKLPPGVNLDPADPWQIAEFYAARFMEDARALGLKVADDAQDDPSLMPRASASIPGMIEVIRRLVNTGHAYVSGESGARAVYFRVRSFPDYGRLSGNTLDRLREGAGGRISGENQSQKEHPADFLLWKEDPAHVMKWDSPWGTGYPGWHIECTVMSAARLAGAGGPLAAAQLASLVIDNARPIIDIHSGGEDNIFPHHECEIAQSCCAFNQTLAGAPFAGAWFHPRFLLVEGEKMSKSKGNFFTARDLFARGVEPAALRLELIKTHYRSNANFTEQGLRDSQRMVERWRRYVEAGESGGGEAEGRADDYEAAFAAALDDDLNIARAVAQVNRLVSEVPGPERSEAAALRRMDAVLGVLSLERPSAAETDIGVFIGVEPDPAVVHKLTQRAQARRDKNFKRSDEIRAELAALGYTIKDAAGGKVEVRRK